MAEGGKEAERRRLAAALRANLKRRKAGKPAPDRTPREPSDGTAEPDRNGERG